MFAHVLPGAVLVTAYRNLVVCRLHWPCLRLRAPVKQPLGILRAKPRQVYLYKVITRNTFLLCLAGFVEWVYHLRF